MRDIGFNPKRDALNAIEIAICVEGALVLAMIGIAAVLVERWL